MRRILAATLIGVLTGSLFTTVEPIISTPPPAEAAVTVDGCEVAVSVAGAPLTGTGSTPQIGAAGNNPSHVEVSKVGDDCVLEFLKPSEEMVWTLPTGVDEIDALVVGGGGGGAMGGGGGGGLYDTTSSGNSSFDVSGWTTAKIRVGSAGNAGNRLTKGGNGGKSFLLGNESDGSFTVPAGAIVESNQRIAVLGGGGGARRDSSDATSRAGGISGFSGGGSVKEVHFNAVHAAGHGGFGAGEANRTDGTQSQPAANSVGGNGEAGSVSTISGGARSFSGGGGGGASHFPFGGGNGEVGGSGGSGGGGNGANPGQSGSPNTGGGGGGGLENGGTGQGGSGGSGVVIVRYGLPAVGPDPVFASVEQTETGFEVPISNYYSVASDGSGVGVNWSVSATNGATVSIDASGLVSAVFSDATLAGLASGASVSSTVTATATAAASGYSTASASMGSAGQSRSGQASLAVSGSDVLRFGGSITVAASGGSGSGAVAFALTSASVTAGCELTGSVLSAGSADAGDSCEVEATRASDSDFVAKTVSETFTIGKADRFVSFTSSVPADPRVNDTYTPTATATGSGSVSFAVSGACSIASGVVTFTSASTCTITASSGSDTNYEAATNVTQSIVVGLANQTITFGAVADKDFDDRPFQLSASSSRGLDVSFATSSSACSVTSGGVVSIDATGLCAVTASQAGVSGQIAAASNVVQTFRVQAVVPGAPRLTSVGFGDGSLTVGFIAPDYVGGGTISAYRAVATDSSNNQIVNNACGTSSPCTITGLTNGTTYTVTIAAVNEAGVGPVSNTSPATAPADRAQAVSGLSTVPGDGVLDVTWDQPSNTTELGGGNFTRYDVSIRPTGGSYGTAVTPDGTNNLTTLATNSYQFTGLTNGTGYDVKVEAITDANSSQLVGRTAETSGVPAVAPSVVRDAEAVLVGNTGAFVSWATPASDGGLSITSYEVTPSSLSCTFGNPTDQFCDITGLARGVTVSISIAAVNGIGAGQTVTVTVSTPALPSSGGGGDDTATPTPTASPTTGNVPRGFGNRPGNGDTRPGAGTPPPPPGGTAGSPVAPERPGASIGGVPVPTTTTASPGGRGVSVSAGGVDVGVDVPDPGDGRGGVIDRDGTPEPVVTPGQGTTVSGAGAAPGSVVDVWLPGRGNTGPTNVAQIPVGPDGTFRADVDVFSDLEEPLPIGRNVVQIVTTNDDGQQILVDMPFTLAQGEPLPEVFRDTQQTPNAPVEGIVNTNKGDPTLTRVTSVPDQGLVNVESDTWVFTIQVNTQDAAVEGEDTDTVIRMAQNSDVTVTGSGFMPDTRVDVWAFSTPTLLGNAIVDDSGTVSVTVALTPQALTIGDHTLQLQAVGEDGFIRSSNLPVTIQDTPLAAPTSDSAATLLWWVVGVTGVLVAVIITVTLIARQRRNA